MILGSSLNIEEEVEALYDPLTHLYGYSSHEKLRSRLSSSRVRTLKRNKGIFSRVHKSCGASGEAPERGKRVTWRNRHKERGLWIATSCKQSEHELHRNSSPVSRRYLKQLIREKRPVWHGQCVLFCCHFC
ncbi:unnamed protein product [Microthlaspi erraticum]|uniref:Uncharacterized protein n=1 Tax=Microthlaspi erraticum TaxID=1685480 RepID=A0A6D2J6W7_9BRAS|nr:unnamed protein product [Microthlaspi erraticum]